MASSPESESDNSGQESPEIEISIGGESIKLTWQNTVLRTFLVGLGAFDHLEYTPEDGQRLGILLNFDGADELKRHLEDNKFPFRVDPELDKKSREWYMEGQQLALDSEWARFDPSEKQ